MKFPISIEQMGAATTEELMNFASHSSLYLRVQDEAQKADARAHVNAAMDELAARGVNQVPMAHWNFGSSGRNVHPPGDRYDPDWYKKRPQQSLLARLWGRITSQQSGGSRG